MPAPMVGEIVIGEPGAVNSMAWFESAQASIRRDEAEQKKNNAALLHWHHLYRWPAAREAAWSAPTKECYDALMFVADHMGPPIIPG